MINSLCLKNFKCFNDLKLDFSNVNILTGLNGMGKSTVMQSILLLAQSPKSLNTEGMLPLKGKYVNLGVGQDVLYEKAEKDEIGICIDIDNKSVKIWFDYKAEMDMLNVRDLHVEGAEKGWNWEERIASLLYLSAYRIEPQFLYQIGNESDLASKFFKKNGEYAIQFLKLYGDKEVKNKSIIFGDSEKNTIADQVKKWLNAISPGVAPVININSSSRTAELQYEYIENREKTNSYKSVNVGFGITYVLPVVVGLIAAKQEDILLIENPEAHIHPKGQRMLGELIALAGAGGVQIIVETHSDHILNGIRVAVKKRQLDAQKTGIFFFYKDAKDSYIHKVSCPVMDESGRFDRWPEDFFDEWDNALLELL